MIKTIRKLKQLLDPRDRLQMSLLLIPMMLISILEMASIAMILPLIEVVMGGASNHVFSAKVLAYFPDMDRQALLLFVAIGFSAFFIFKNLLILAMVVLINWFTNRKMAAFLQNMYELYLRRPYAFHLNRNSAEIQRNLNYSGPTAFDGLRLALGLIMESALVCATILTLLLCEPVITLVSALILGIFTAILFFVVSPFMRRWGQKSHDLQGGAFDHINKSLGAIRDIKVMNLYSHMISVYQNLTNSFARYLTLSTSQQHVPRLFLETLIVIGFLILVLISSAIDDSKETFIPTLGLFGMAALRLMPSMNRILNAATELHHRTAHIDSLHSDMTNGIKEAEYPERSTKRSLEFNSVISIENLTFSYSSEIKAALKKINFKINKGESIGLVGPSGSGKTTLVDIFLGFLQPSDGRLLVDGQDVFSNLYNWQQNLGYVPQHIFLADDTLRRNIAFGVADSNIDSRAVDAAIDRAFLRNVVDQLPNGLDTIIGENGIRLSGGQRQRVGIARALYRSPSVLVFDEATSSLDTETERKISESIEALTGERTLLIIAHRLSTVRNCNRVVFLNNGEIEAIGTFNDLYQSHADFRRLVDSDHNYKPSRSI